MVPHLSFPVLFGMAIERPAKGNVYDVKYTHTHTQAYRRYTNEYMINECGRIELQVYVM